MDENIYIRMFKRISMREKIWSICSLVLLVIGFLCIVNPPAGPAMGILFIIISWIASCTSSIIGSIADSFKAQHWNEVKDLEKNKKFRIKNSEKRIERK